MTTETKIKFKVLDVRAKKIIRDSSFFNATVERDNGIATVWITRDDVRPLMFTGHTTDDGEEIYEDDLVEAIIDNERIVDVVHKDEVGVWVLGEYDGTILDYPIVKIVGNRNETVWPQPETDSVPLPEPAAAPAE